MKSFLLLLVSGFVPIMYSLSTTAAEAGSAAAPGSTSDAFVRFAKENDDLEEWLAKKQGVQVPARVRDFFNAAEKGDWLTSSNLFSSMEAERRSSSAKAAALEPWHPVPETYAAFWLFHMMDPKFRDMYCTDIVKSVPPGSIYFCGTDPGRFLISVYSQSHTEGRTFFTVMQDQLVDTNYLSFLADIYIGKINLPDTNDFKKCLDDYMADAQARLRHDQEHPNEPRQIKPDEDVHLDSSGQVQVASWMSGMKINALLAKLIFEKNPTNEFFLEESFPLDWMFPHLAPAGLIMKLNRQSLPLLGQDILRRDHEFWSDYTGRLIGNWITYDTPVKDITAFAEKVYLNHDFSNFHGDVKFVRNAQSQKVFSKLRSSIGGVYEWRLGKPPSGVEMPQEYVAVGADRTMISREADFAFKQALALCPDSPEAVYRYAQLLVNLRRIDDAVLVARTAAKLDPRNPQFSFLVKNLEGMQNPTP